MQSGKQKRAAIMQKRQIRRQQATRPDAMPLMAASPRCLSSEQVNRSRLKSYNSYGDPEFVTRGYFEDKPFRCVDCKSEQIWTAKQQKWWYETAQGAVYTTAIRCRACRQIHRAAPHLKKEAKCKTTIK